MMNGLRQRPKIELLLLSCRTSIDALTAARLRDLAQRKVDWPWLVAAAGQHGIIPLIHRSLASACWDLVPLRMQRSLEASSKAIAIRGLFLTEKLVRILDVFAASGIGIIPFKGPTLAASAYGSVALRECADLDVLVRPADAPAALAVLLASGYELRKSAVDSASAALCDYNYVLLGQRGSCMAELHWALTPPYFDSRVAASVQWDRLSSLKLAGRSVPVLPIEDLLLALCVHGAKHTWGRLKWICDVAELLRAQPDINWEGLLQRARSLGCERMLLLAVNLAQALLDANVPASVQERARTDEQVRPLTSWVCDRLFRDPGPATGIMDRSMGMSSVSLRTACCHVRMRERLSDKLRYCWRLAQFLATPNARDRAVMPLPVAMHPLLYLIRPFRLVAVHCRDKLRRTGLGRWLFHISPV